MRHSLGTITHDGCLKQVYVSDRTGQPVTKRKRRPAGVTDEQCTWHESVRCPDHPKK